MWAGLSGWRDLAGGEGGWEEFVPGTGCQVREGDPPEPGCGALVKQQPRSGSIRVPLVDESRPDDGTWSWHWVIRECREQLVGTAVRVFRVRSPRRGTARDGAVRDGSVGG
jgi:hypothetical protein